MHTLAVPESEEQLADFMEFVNSNVARKVGRLHGWREKLWSRRYVAIPISHEEAAQVARLRYVLSHGPKECLVEHAADWPGVQVVSELCRGDSDVHGGLWRDQSEEYEARRRASARRDPPKSEQFVTRESFRLAPLPCWAHRDHQEVAKDIRLLVRDIDEEYRQRRKENGSSCLGGRRILAQGPFDHPINSKRSPAPLCHAASREARLRLIATYKAFVAAYMLAAQRLREGVGLGEAGFPPGCYPPGLPFLTQPRAGPAPI
jgi:hypothetical protein